MKCSLSRTCNKKKSTNLYKVANVQQLECLISIFANIINTKVDLYTTSSILYLRKSSLAHITHQANTPGECKVSLLSLPLTKVLKYIRYCIGTLYTIRIGINTFLPQCQ